MKDVTPAKFACVATFSCPAIIEVTPQDMRCQLGFCPAVFDVTPAAMACGGTMSARPAIFDVTPGAAACVIGVSCPAIYEREDGHIIIGKIMGFAPQTADREAMLAGVPEEIRPRIGPDEFAIWVPKGLVKPGDGASG
jgi:hypothetical protein